MRGFFAFLARKRWILEDPATHVPLPKSDALPRDVLSEAQARRLMSAPSYQNPRWWARPLELQDLLHGTLWVRNGKGRKDRVVPVTGAAAAALDSYVREGRPPCLRPA